MSGNFNAIEKTKTKARFEGNDSMPGSGSVPVLSQPIPIPTPIPTPIPNSMSFSQEQLQITNALFEHSLTSSQPTNLENVLKVFTDHEQFLQSLLTICPKLPQLLSHILTFKTTVKQNKARVSAGSEATRLRNLTDAEAATLGKSFKKFLLGNKEFATAVNAWKLDNPILEPLFTVGIFEPIIIAIAKELMAASKLGLAKRVIIGALLSIGDMITDIWVIISYLRIGNTSGAYSLMAMIGSSLSVQLLVTYALKRKTIILREMLFVVTFLKPAVDAYRVATGYEDEESIMSPLVELITGKMTELSIESVPGGLLQAYMFINTPEKTTFFMISILISALTTGFSSAMISYDMDVSVANRKEVPLFYGYIKDGNTERMITFILQVSEGAGGGLWKRAKLTLFRSAQILLASFHNLSRTIGTALLFTVSGRLTFGVIIAEMFLYHLYKVGRRDYVLWIVGIEGTLKYICAIIVHSIVKVLVDYTGERVKGERKKKKIQHQSPSHPNPPRRLNSRSGTEAARRSSVHFSNNR